MKLYKYLLISLAALCFTACSDDDNDWNTAAGVTVSMKEAQMDVIESMGIFGVPIEVTGNPNGPVQVTVEVAENGVGPAMENVHYIVTSKTINISASEKVGQVEIETIDDWDINDPRSFTVTIKNVEGASVGSIGTTTVNLIDEDDQPYNLMRGTWILTGYDADNNPVELPISIETPKPGTNEYGKKLYAYGVGPSGACWIPFKFKYNEVDQSCTVSIPLNSFMSGTSDNELFNFGDFKAAFKTCGIVVRNNKLAIATAGSIVCPVSPDMSEITFDPRYYGLALAIYSAPDFVYEGVYAWYSNVTIKRPE